MQAQLLWGFESDGAGTSGLGTTGLDSQDIAVSASVITGTVWNYADPVINNSPLAFGNFREGDTVTAQTVSITNAAPAAFSESLNAEVDTANTSAGLTASGSFNLLAAQDTNDTDISVTFDTTTAGSRDGTVEIDFVSDGTGTSGLGQTVLASQNVTVTGDVYRLAQAGTAAPNPVVLADAHVGGYENPDPVHHQYRSSGRIFRKVGCHHCYNRGTGNRIRINQSA